MRLKGKKAVITGGASGMGEATSIHLAKEGAKVSILDVNLEGAKDTVKQIESIGGEGYAFKVDLRNLREIEEGIEASARAMQGINVLVNDAGVWAQASIEETDETNWDFNLDINLKGTFFACKAAIPYMLKEGKGRIINFASIAAKVGFHRSIAYCASKGGVQGLTRAMAAELGPRHVNVNCIAPGSISTPMNAQYVKDPDYVKKISDATPNRRFGYPSDISPAVVFLASDESDFINGITLFVDGGWVIV